MAYTSGFAFVSLLTFLVALSAPLEAKNVVLLMDGTGNTLDSEQSGERPSKNTNIAKLKSLHLLDDGETQVVRYVAGVGTEGGELARAKDGAIAKSAPNRVKQAYEVLAEAYQPGDAVSIFGFSRGAATARMLCRKIATDGINGDRNVEIRFLGLFDTVAALGVPDKNMKAERLEYDDVADKLRIPANVRHVVHLVSIDEDRAAFRPTLVQCVDARRTKVDEVWFAGDHSDIGGSWEIDEDSPSLSDVTLDYMIRKACEHGVLFKRHVENPNPNGEGDVHSVDNKTRKYGGDHPRKIISHVAAKARVHSSVMERLKNNSRYRPRQLSGSLEVLRRRFEIDSFPRDKGEHASECLMEASEYKASNAGD